MPKVDLSAELAQKLLHTLEQQRQTGSDYPLTAARLAALAHPSATSEQVSKGLAKKPFAAKWIVANKKDPNSPLALAEDTGSPGPPSPILLEYTLGLCVQRRQATASADKSDRQSRKKALKPAFKAALERQIAEQSLSALGRRDYGDRNKPQLYLQQFPPPPPKKKPAEELSEKLVQELSEQRGTDAYPLPLDRLVEQTGIRTTPAIVKQALGRGTFPQSGRTRPAASAGTARRPWRAIRMPASPPLWRSVLSLTLKPDNQAVSVADLKKKLPKNLQGSFNPPS